MCLISNFDYPSVAEGNLICYKVYILVNDDYVSPYQKANIPNIGEVATTSLQPPGLYLVTKGFHSFASLIDAVDEADLLTTVYHCKTCIFRCTIPKDTKYYEGKFNRAPSYCSESIIIEESEEVIHWNYNALTNKI